MVNDRPTATASASPATQYRNAGLDIGQASLIDVDSAFDGVFVTTQNLRIEGEYKGEIQCDGTLTIAETARVSGVLHAGNITVSGLLQGQVTCDGRFEILQSGQVSARVVARSVVVREGAFYEGEMRMHDEPAGLPTRELPPGVTQIAADGAQRRGKRPEEKDTLNGGQPSGAALGENGREAAEQAAAQASSEV